MNQDNNKQSLSAEDWLDAALEVVAERGLKALAIEPLAKRIGISKGSFYWHFKNRRALLLAMLHFWNDIEISYQQQLLRDNPEPKQLLSNLFILLLQSDVNRRIFLALSHELDDAAVRDTYEQAVNRRITLFEEAYVASGMATSQASLKALMGFHLYLGLIKSLNDTPEMLPELNSQSEFMQAVIAQVLP